MITLDNLIVSNKLGHLSILNVRGHVSDIIQSLSPDLLTDDRLGLYHIWSLIAHQIHLTTD